MIKSTMLPAESLLSLSGCIKVGRSKGPKAEKMEYWMCVCESDKRMSRIIKLMLRGSAGEECEQVVGESERTTVAFSLYKLTETVRLSTSLCDCHFLVFLMNTTQNGRKKERNTHNGRLKAVHKSLFLLCPWCFYQTVWRVVIFTKLYA